MNRTNAQSSSARCLDLDSRLLAVETISADDQREWILLELTGQEKNRSSKGQNYP
jgi:hypothetical protein